MWEMFSEIHIEALKHENESGKQSVSDGMA